MIGMRKSMRLKVVPPINQTYYFGKAYGRNNSLVGEIRYYDVSGEYCFYPATTDGISAQTMRELAETLKMLNDTL